MKSIIPLCVSRTRLLRTLGIIGILFVLSCTGSDPAPSLEPGNITTIAGVAGQFDYKGDGGLATSANLGFITGITLDNTGNIYFVDGAANVVRKIDRSTGIISTVAGTFLGFNVVDPMPAKGDGGPATEAHLNVPYGVAADASGNIYITDNGNSIVRKVDVTTGLINRIAGKPGTFGYAGDGGLATNAELNNPYDVAVDHNGNVFIVDSQNEMIRKITSSTGIISRVAGMGPAQKGYDGDNGPAISAHLNSPQGIAVDEEGNLYIVDSGNHVVRKVEASTGTIITIAGTGTYGYEGDGKQAILAKLYAPRRVAIDANGDMYIADQGSHVIRKVSKATGIISTLAGVGTAGYSGDGGPAIEAKLSHPQGVAVDASGKVFITESGNGVIRAVTQE